MAQNTEVKVRLKKPSLLVIVVIVVVLALSLTAVLTVRSAIRATRAETDALRGEAYAQEQLSERLERYIQELGTVRGILRIAQEELGLVEPGTIVFDTETGN